jgi:hypothetical protein
MIAIAHSLTTSAGKLWAQFRHVFLRAVTVLAEARMRQAIGISASAEVPKTKSTGQSIDNAFIGGPHARSRWNHAYVLSCNDKGRCVAAPNATVIRA